MALWAQAAAAIAAAAAAATAVEAWAAAADAEGEGWVWAAGMPAAEATAALRWLRPNLCGGPPAVKVWGAGRCFSGCGASWLEGAGEGLEGEGWRVGRTGVCGARTGLGSNP